MQNILVAVIKMNDCITLAKSENKLDNTLKKTRNCI